MQNISMKWLLSAIIIVIAIPIFCVEIVFVDGKAVATTDDLKDSIDAMSKEQPMLKEMLKMMPNDQKALAYKQILDSFIDQFIIAEYVHSMKWDESESYKKNAVQMHRMLDKQLATNEFRKRIIKPISDKEAEEYYNNNRKNLTQEPFLTHVGGIEAVAVKFEHEAEAKSFLEKARQAKDLRRVAAEAKRQLIEMGIVSPQSAQHDFGLVGKILSSKNVPAFDMVPSADKKSFFVFHAIRKVDAQYAPYAIVAAKIKELMASENLTQEYDKQLNALKAKRSIKILSEIRDDLIN